MDANPTEHPFPVLDNHCHLDRRGEFLGAVRAFWRAGGTHLNVVHKPDFSSLPTDGDGYRRSLVATCDLVDQVNAETPVVAFATVSPHPVELTRHVENGMALEEAEALVRDGLDAAARLVSEGRAIALGEVGRPHFDVPEPVMEAADRLFDHSMELARDLDCAAVIHSGVSEATTKTIGTGQRALICRAAAIPSISRNCWSISTTSGCNAWISSTACRPWAVSPTTT